MLYSLRELDTIDIKSVQEIERAIFPTLWPRTPFKKELKNKMAKYLVAYAIEDTQNKIFPISNKIAPTILNKLWSGFSIIFQQINQYGYKSQTLNPNIVGLVGTWYMTDEAHITGIGVRELYRGRGYGELLLMSSILRAMDKKSETMTLEVRVSNSVAQALYQKYGFKNTGLMKRYYTDNHEDAYIMSTDRIQSLEFRDVFGGLQNRFRSRRGEVQYLWD